MINGNDLFYNIINTELLVNILINTIIGVYSFKTKKLTKNASILAFLIGSISYLADHGLFFILVAFFLSSSYLTKFGNAKKEKFLSEHNKEKVRSVKQVLCNGLVPALMALTIVFLRDILGKCNINCKFSNNNLLRSHTCLFETQLLTRVLYLIYFSYVACCNGDTWASEVGVLAKNNPRLITNMKCVPKGTNGGISILGSLMACFGGIFIGFLFAITQYYSCSSYKFDKLFYTTIFIGLFSGFFGSALDSFLGATLQLTVYDQIEKKVVSKTYSKKYDGNKNNFILYGKDVLSNDSVNFLSATFTAVLTVILYLIFMI